LLVAIYAINT